MGPQNLGTQSPHFTEEKLWLREAVSSWRKVTKLGLEPFATRTMFSSTTSQCFLLRLIIGNVETSGLGGPTATTTQLQSKLH